MIIYCTDFKFQHVSNLDKSYQSLVLYLAAGPLSLGLKLISERVGAFEVTFRIGVRVSADLTPHSGVAHDSGFHIIHQFSVNRGSDSHLGQKQSHVHIPFCQSQGSATTVDHRPHGMVVEVHLHLDLHTRD